MTSNNTGTAIVGGDWPNALPVTTYAEPKAKQTGLDWGSITPSADTTAPAVVAKARCITCGAVLTDKVCTRCQELEEARRDATFIQPKPEPEPLPEPAVADVPEPAEPSLLDEWAQLLSDTVDSTDRTIVSARFLVFAAVEHLRLVASTTSPAARPARKPKRARRPAAPQERRGGRPRANTAAIVKTYAEGNSINEISALLGYAKGTIRTHLLEAGVELRDDRHTKSGGANRRTDTPEEVEDVRRLYVDERLSQSRVAERLGIGVKVVQGIMRRNGIEGREGQSGGGDTLVEIRQRLADLGVRSADVRAWARDQGIEVSERGVIPTKLLDQYEAARP